MNIYLTSFNIYVQLSIITTTTKINIYLLYKILVSMYIVLIMMLEYHVAYKLVENLE